MKKCCLLLLLSFLPILSYSQSLKAYFPYYRSVQQAQNLSFDELSDVIYAFALLEADGSITILEENLFLALKTAASQHPTKLHMGIGGWGLSQNFSSVVGNSNLRAQFVQNALNLCIEHNLAGIDLDWEFPSDNDAPALHNLLTEMKAAFSGGGYELSIAVGGEEGHKRGYTTASIQVPDFIHIMSYDGPNHATIAQMVGFYDRWIQFGAAPEKIVMGVPFYGRCAGEASFADISTSNPAQAYHQDSFNGYCYNGAPTLEAKVDSAMKWGAAGMMIWEVTHDRSDQYSLLTALNNQLEIHREANAGSLRVPNYQKKYGDSSFFMNVESTEPGNISWSIQSGNGISIDSNGWINIITTGITNIEVIRSGPNPDTANSQVTVNPRMLTYTAHPKSKNYLETNPILTFDISGFVNGENATNLTQAPTISTTATASSDIGIYPIVFSGGQDPHYSFQFSSAILSIYPIPASVQITSADEAEQGSLHSLTATCNSGGSVSWEFIPDDGNGLLYFETQFIALKAGNGIFKATCAAAGNYSQTFEEQWFTITPFSLFIEREPIVVIFEGNNLKLTSSKKTAIRVKTQHGQVLFDGIVAGRRHVELPKNFGFIIIEEGKDKPGLKFAPQH
ncbi:MAG: chitinase [Sphingobacteriales bacterium]|jgi:chitinase